MKLDFNIGSFATAGTAVADVKNFDPFTLSFWATMVGVLVWSIVGGLIWELITGRLKINVTWDGTGRTPSKDL